MQFKTKETIRLIIRHAKKHKFWLMVCIIGATISSSMQMIWPLFIGQLVDILSQTGEKAELLNSIYPIFYNIVFVASTLWASNRAFDFAMVKHQVNSIQDITDRCFEYIHRHSYRFFSDNFSGSLVKKVNRLARAFEDIFDIVFYDLYRMAIKIIFTLVVLFYFSPILGGIMGVWLIIFLVANYALAKFKLRYDTARASADTKVTGYLADTITNNSNIQLFASNDYENEQFQKVTNNWKKRAEKAWKFEVYIEAGQAALIITLEILIIFICIKLWAADQLTIGQFVIIETYIFEIIIQIWRFGQNIQKIYERLADAEEMTEILNLPHEIQDQENAKELKVISGKIKFENVEFSYSKESKKVFDGLSLNIKSGEKVALVGPSGGGKSTIIKLILRLFDLDKGKIIIDNQDISKVTQDSLRSKIALVPQDPILFHRELIENIRYGRKEASDEEVFAAARLAECHEFIMNTPKKYKTLVGERGIKLSGGQRQRIAIARAILKNAPVLILDEATSSLDSESEMLIQKALDNLMKNKTTLIIAHRLSTIMKADKILVLSDGKIIEEGVHADLVNAKGGLYQKLWELQVGGYL